MPDAKTFAEQSEQRRSQHRISVVLTIVLPFVGAFLLLLVLAVAAVSSGNGTTVANIFVIGLMLCPLAICMLPIYLLIVVLISLLGRSNQALGKGLVRVSGLVNSGEEAALGLTERAAKLTIRWNSAFAGLDKTLFSLFDPPNPKSESKPDTKDIE